MGKTAQSNADKFSYSKASDDNWKILEGLHDPELRQKFIEHLREHEWTVFVPREIDFEKFSDLLEKNPEIRKWVENEDPVILARVLSASYPDLFYTIEHVYEIATDWKIKRTRKREYSGGGSAESPRIPGHLLSTLTDHELRILAHIKIRERIKKLNRDPRLAIAEIKQAIKTEKDPKERQLFEYLHDYMKELVEMKFPAFVSELVSGSPFPSMHVRVWIKQILERGSALIIGDVGTQKTSAAIIGLELLGAKSVVVICRSYAREMVWQNEIKRYYREPPEPFVVYGSRDLPALNQMTLADLRRHHFCIVGYGSIQSGIEDGEGEKVGDQITEAIAKLNPDAIIIDEAHAIKNKAKRSDRVLRLAQLPSIKHRLMLTATPFENNPNEVTHLATLLDPINFPNENVFLTLCRNNPRIFFSSMTQRMCDYFAQDDVLDLPPINISAHNPFPIVELACPDDLRLVHEAIQNDATLEEREQILRMTRLLAIPYVGKDWYPELSNLSCFCDPQANPKLAYLKAQTSERIKNGKVIIASGIFASGITRKLNGATVDPVHYEIASLFEHWFPGQVLRMDAEACNGNGKREQIIQEWRNNPKAKILIASVPATSESLSFALKRAHGIEHLTVYFLSLPWKPTQYWQFIGRPHRPGSEVPVEIFVPILKGTADEALLELNERKWRNFLIGVHGMPIFTDEEEALEKATFEKVVTTPARWLREAFGRMLGLGEKGIQEFFQKTLKGLPIEKTIALYYLAVEDYGPSGDASRFMVPIIQQWHNEGVIRDYQEVLDAGCGPLVLERRLNAPVYGVDINPSMLEIGKTHVYHGGQNAQVGCLSDLPVEWTSKFSLVVSSFVLHLTSRKDKHKKEIERVRIIKELNRVLKPDGLLWCIVPEFCFDGTSFNVFLEALSKFGFKTVKPLTGRVESLDYCEHPRVFWSIVMRKQNDVQEDSLPCPLFIYDKPRAGKPKIKGKAQESKLGQSVMIRHEEFSILDCEGKLQDPISAAKKVTPSLDIEIENLLQAITDNFKITDSSVKDKLRKELRRKRPTDWIEFKEVWRNIKEIPGVPRIRWAELKKFAISFFGG